MEVQEGRPFYSRGEEPRRERQASKVPTRKVRVAYNDSPGSMGGHRVIRHVTGTLVTTGLIGVVVETEEGEVVIDWEQFRSVETLKNTEEGELQR